MFKGCKSIVLGLGIVLLAMLCSFASFGSPDSIKLDLSADTSKSKREVKTDLYEQSQVAISLKENRFNEPTDDRSETFSGIYFSTSSAQEYFSKFSLSQYSLYIKNCLINSRKSDLIFPFHYFW